MGRIDEQLQAQGSSLENALILQGQTQEQLKDSINLRLIVEKILADDVGVSDEDAQNYFNENKESQPKGATFDQQKESIKEQLRQQKLGEKYQEWIQTVKGQSNIKYLLNL